MAYTFVLRSKPFSINAATYRDASIKTTEYRTWAAGIFHQLSEPAHQENLKQAREAFNEKTQSVRVSLTAYYPKKYFITKEGNLSARTIDVTNFEKLLVDLLFDKQFNEKSYPNGCPNLNLNDKHIIELNSKKLPHESEEHVIEITVEYVPRPF